MPLSVQGEITVVDNGQTTTIIASDFDEVVLEMVVQYGMASPNQIEQIQRAQQELKERWNITLRVIEIP